MPRSGCSMTLSPLPVPAVPCPGSMPRLRHGVTPALGRSGTAGRESLRRGGAIRNADDPDDDELEEEPEELPVAEPATEDDSSFDDFDDEFDDDFEEDENDPDWDHPDDTAQEPPPPGKGPGKKK